MKSNKVKRLLAATLAATMMMASALTAAAASGGSSGKEEETTTTTEAESSSSNEEAASVAESVVSTVAAIQTNTADARVTVAGTAVQSTVAGTIVVKSVQGVAVTTPKADVKAGLGLSDNQTAAITVFETDAKKSAKAMDCVNAAATALGGTPVAAITVDLAAKENGKIVTLSSGSVGMVVGLPKDADTSKVYSVACVQPGGVVTILEDKDASPITVTFEVKAGLGTYGIIGK